MTDLNFWTLIGWHERDGKRRRVQVEVSLTDQGNDKTRLAISGESGQARKDGEFILRSRNDDEPRGWEGGQIVEELRQVTEFAPGWDAAARDKLAEVWERWHLNDVHAGCEHQRALGWTYETHKGQRCPECDYQIGTAWCYEALPDDVIEYVRKLSVGLT